MNALERFEAKVHKCPTMTTCHIWTASMDRQGYGYFQYGKLMHAHRASYLLYKGRIPKGALVMHTCNQPSCVNPDHLILGTHKANQKQKADQDRSAWGERQHSAKLTEAQVREIFGATGSHESIGSRFGVSQVSVSNIKRGRTWRRVTGAKFTPNHYAKGVHSVRATLTPAQVRQIRKSTKTNLEVAKHMDIPSYIVYNVRARASYRGVA